MPTYVAKVWEGFDPTKEMSLPNAPGDGRPLISMDGDVNFICAACGFTLIENMLASLHFGQPLGAECPRCHAICVISTGVSRPDPDLGV